MAGRLTTHVLDTARGVPAAGLQISLWRLSGTPGDPARELLLSLTTNQDGRSDGPLLQGDAFRAGSYELVFAAGDYLRQSGQAEGGQGGDGSLFLDQIPIRFGVPDASQHYHVPLLLSPFAYSTYRGS